MALFCAAWLLAAALFHPAEAAPQARSIPQAIAPAAGLAALSPSEQAQFALRLQELVGSIEAPMDPPALADLLAREASRPAADPARAAAATVLLQALADPERSLPSLKGKAARAASDFVEEQDHAGIAARSAHARALASLRPELPAAWAGLFDGRFLPAAREFRERFGVEYAPALFLGSELRPSTLKRLRRQEKIEQELDRSFSPKGLNRGRLERRVARSFVEEDADLPDGPTLRWLYGRQIGRGETADIYVAKVGPEIGHGLFAGQDIAPGKMILEYTGVLRPESSAAPGNDHLFSYPIRTLVVDARERGNQGRFLNHSSLEPNADHFAVFYRGAWHVVVVAIKPIRKGEQILFDYRCGEFWEKGSKPASLTPTTAVSSEN